MQSNDLQLIQQCLGGDPDAFAELVRRHQDRLYGAMYQLLRNHPDAQDVVQEAFLLAYQSLATFQQNSEFYTWLYRIAVNAALTMRRKRRPLTGLESSGGQRLGVGVPDLSQGSRPGEAMEEAEDRLQLERALSKLTNRERTLLLLKSEEGQTYQSISEILGIPFGTVRSRLHRAHMKLRNLLERQISSDCGW